MKSFITGQPELFGEVGLDVSGQPHHIAPACWQNGIDTAAGHYSCNLTVAAEELMPGHQLEQDRSEFS